MRIKELPPPIKRLAKRNFQKQHGFWKRLEQFKKGWEIELKVSFIWNHTIEGYEFQYQVDNVNFNFEPRKEVKVQYHTKKIFEAIRKHKKGVKINN